VIYFTAKKKLDEDNSDTNAVISKTITEFDDPTNGKTAIELTPTDTGITAGVYFCDIVVQDADGRRYQTDEGTIEINDGVTNRIVSNPTPEPDNNSDGTTDTGETDATEGE